ncbi:phospholipid-transporting ATPase ABCA1-like isoform X3 [Corythoichthys intestinalis]|uniref:phospholipid-transporting ATPase ABCA1-like isoform X3 n=1 Tax=Corythoichthys intestinalis TaxID=161448 RepID=UPI0025A59E4C|nr:phospholipid-transporting ATPase ABCA1-like isoform X3 [Corythoichthys intestinalis]
MGVSQQLGVLLWKNILYYRAHKVAIFLEVACTLLISLLLFDMRRTAQFSLYPEDRQTIYEAPHEARHEPRLPSGGTLRGAYERYCCNEKCDFKKSVISHFYNDIKRFLDTNPEEFKKPDATFENILNNFPSFMKIQEPLQKFFWTGSTEFLCSSFENAKKLLQLSRILDDPHYSSCVAVNNALNKTIGKGQPVGNLLYTPDTPVVRSVMNTIFEDLQIFKNFKKKWLVLEEILKPKGDISPESVYQILNDTITILDKLTECFLEKLEGCTNEDQLISRAQELQRGDQFWAGVVFELPDSATDLLPSDVTYKIRMDSSLITSHIIYDFSFWWPGILDEGGYLSTGFVRLQYMVEMALIKKMINKTRNIGVYVEKMPYTCYSFSNTIFHVFDFLPYSIVFLWMVNFAVTINDLVHEKEACLKETMKIMGLKTRTLWLSWFITSLVPYLLSTVIILIIFKLGNILPRSNWMVVFILLISFASASIMLCFLISTLFSNPTMATACGAVIYFFSILAYIPLFLQQNLPSTTKFLASFLCTVAFSFGLVHINNAEVTGEGVQWSNFQFGDGDAYNFHTCIAMLYVDAFIYATAAWYIEAVFPDCIEADPSEMILGVHISNLVKIYKKGGKMAVNHLDLKFYQGQITSLLGQNGAGKTTTMSILIGLFLPTSGTVYIQGMDIRNNMDIIRRTLGFCPQHNVLFDFMTVQEHVWFYARLRGISEKKVKAGINSWLKSVGLLHKRHEWTKFLSGGMKRKLSVAIAFIGGPKVVVLDEPTAGMDPHARRGIWDMLLKYRRDRTIILATHYMDEAEILADRIAIISQGRLCCCGSPLFLKSKLGVGSTLTLVKENRPGTCNGDTSAGLAALQSMVHRHFPTAKLMELCYEVTINIPQEDCEPRRMAALLSELNQNLSTFGTTSYGLSDSKLEDIFLRVVKDSEDNVEPARQTDPPERTGESQNIEQQVTNLLSETGHGVTLTGWRLIWHQLRGLFIKRYLCIRRDLQGLFSQIGLPFLIVLIGLWATAERSRDVNLELHPCMYGEQYIFFSKSDGTSEDVKEFEDTLLDLPGFSTKCRGNSILSYEDRTLSNWTQVPNQMDDADCKCKDNPNKRDLQYFPDCQQGAVRPPQIHNKAPGIILQNLTNYNVQDHLIKSYPHLIKKSMEIKMFIEELRFGGFSIRPGLPDDLVQNYVTIWYNRKALHSLVSFVNVVSNAFLRQKAPDSSITAYNHPLLLGDKKPAPDSTRHYLEFLLQCCVLSAMSVVPFGLMLFLTNERVSQAKQLQFVSGVKPIIYWVANLLWDLMNYSISALTVVLLFLGFQHERNTNATNLPAFILLLLLYGTSTITLMYTLSFMFTVATKGCTVVTGVNVFFGIIILMDLLPLNSTGKQMFMILPIYSFADGLKNLEQVHESKSKKDPFDQEFVGKKLIIMAGESVIFFLFTIMLEYKFFIQSEMLPCTKIPLGSEDEDEDVAMERQRAESGQANSDMLTMINLTKIYRGKSKPAVNQLCLGIPRGECFGLLGVNGAGKTTTFRMLTGDTTVSFGNAFLNNCSVAREMDKVHQRMGYCPQFDTMWGLLTGTEHLELYARLRGVPEESVTKVAELALKKLGLSKLSKQKAEVYSVGNMRRLNTAIALIGAPPVIFLDEPTTGMDSLAKRFMWDNIRSLNRDGRSVVLTSHSMEECEALCSRIAIMVSGSFMCLGSVQHLKNRFGGGYVITLRLADSECNQDTSPVVIFMKNAFPVIKLKKQYHNIQQYQLPANACSLAEVFNTLANNYEELGIRDFSVSQTTLDQVFVNFASEYTEDQTRRPKPGFWTQFCSARIQPDAPIPLQPIDSLH